MDLSSVMCVVMRKKNVKSGWFGLWRERKRAVNQAASDIELISEHDESILTGVDIILGDFSKKYSLRKALIKVYKKDLKRFQALEKMLLQRIRKLFFEGAK